MKRLFSIIIVLALLTSCGGGGGGSDSEGSSNPGGGVPTVQSFEATPDGIVVSGYESEFPEYQTAVLSWEVANAEGHRIELAWTEGEVAYCSSTPGMSMNCPELQTASMNMVNVQEVPAYGSMEVTPGQDTTYYLLIDGQVAQINNTWTPNSGMDTLPATANVYVYDPDNVVSTLNYIMDGHANRWADGTIRVYDTTGCPGIQEAIDFWNSKLPDNVNLTMTNDPNSWDIMIEDASSSPSPPGAAWASCNVDQAGGTYRYETCWIEIYGMDSICDINGQYYTYTNSVGVLAHEFGHALGMTLHPYDSRSNTYAYPEDSYDPYRRPSLMGSSTIESMPDEEWTPLLDIFFRHLYSMPPGTCMDAGLC